VLERRSGDDPSVEAYTFTMPAIADKFITDYDNETKCAATGRAELAEGQTSVADLLSTIRSLLPLAVRDSPGFDASDFGDQPGVADDVIGDGERLHDAFSDRAKDKSKDPIPYADKVLAVLDKALVKAVKEWSEAEAAVSLQQKLLAQVRESGTAFDNELQLFRRTLAAAVGRKDKDFQKLRSARASHADEDDDPSAPRPPGVVEPAPEGVNEPRTR